MAPASRVLAALVETEGRVAVGHQGGVAGHPQHPPVQPEHQVEDLARVTPGEQEDDRGDEHQQPDQAGAGHQGGAGAGAPAEAQRRAADQDAHDQVVRDRQQPPLHQDQAARERLRVLDPKVGRVVGDLGQRERRVPVGAQRAVGVEGHPPAPAHHPDVEGEDRARVAAGDQDRDEGAQAQHREGEPQEDQHDVVREHQQPLHQPPPPRHSGVQRGVDVDRGRGRLHGVHLLGVGAGVPASLVRAPRRR